MVKSYFWVLHLLLISAGSYFVADMANLSIGSKLEASIEVPKQPTTTPVRASLKGEGGSDYSSIIEGNIFNSKLRGKKVEAPTTAQPLPAASSVPLNVNLLGTVVGSEGISFAIIEDGKTKEQLLYALGDFLAEDAKIIQISRNKVTLLRGNEKETLEVSLVPEENKGAPRLLSPVSQAASGAGIRQISKNRWVLDRREIEGAVDNLPQLLTKARIIPNFSDGKPDGFRIFAISEESLFAKIGLQNGDVLHRVNGIEVKDPQNFLKVFQQLKDETSVTVDLARNNQKETFSYEIR